MLTKLLAIGIVLVMVSRFVFRTRVQTWGRRSIRLLDAALILMALAYVGQWALVVLR